VIIFWRGGGSGEEEGVRGGEGQVREECTRETVGGGEGRHYARMKGNLSGGEGGIGGEREEERGKMEREWRV